MRNPRCSRHLPRALLAFSFLLGLPAAGQDSVGVEAAPNPFADFETHYLSNGVKVWFKHLAGAPEVSISTGVPVGRDADPPGKAHLSHLLEHMLFTDRDDRTEQEIRDAAERLGGRLSGVSYTDHTWYKITIERQHGIFAIEWLADLMAPHPMDPVLVERNLRPLLVELGARPPDLFDRLIRFLTPGKLAPPNFWEREFGIATDPHPRVLWSDLHSITSDDLRDFYDRYYAPGNFTVTIIGDLDRQQALATAERTFGSLPPRPVNRWPVPLRDPGRSRTEYRWHLGPGHYFRSEHKLYNPTAEELLTGLFVQHLLGRRINQRLRWGERKAAYLLEVYLGMHGPAAVLRIQGDIERDEYAIAGRVIDSEIESLRTGSIDPAEFEENRAVAVDWIRSQTRTAEALNDWTVRRFYDPAIFTDFPDLVSFYESVSQDEVTSFASMLFDDSRRVVTVTRALPVGPVTLAAAVVAALALVLVLAKWERDTPTRDEVNYIARLRMPGGLRIGYGVVLAASVVFAVHVGRTGFDWAADRWLYTVDSLLLQTAVKLSVPFAAVLALCRVGSLFPHELLVAGDHLRVRSRTWRARVLKQEDIAEISMRGFRDLWLTRHLFRCAPLTFGVRRPGIHIQTCRGRSYYFRSRNTVELAEVLGAWRKPARAATCAPEVRPRTLTSTRSPGVPG